ncbi:MAG: hypothetical protein MZV64_13570 [Ignavibacteriales bacterium]|nr:hypothetical protein [Ignavibacteriales bacterium]
MRKSSTVSGRRPGGHVRADRAKRGRLGGAALALAEVGLERETLLARGRPRRGATSGHPDCRNSVSRSWRSALGPRRALALAIQFAPQDGQPLVEAGLDRAQGASLQLGDLLERQPVVLLQDDGGALFLRQQAHGAGHVPPEVLARHDIFDRLLRRRLARHEVGDVDALGRRHERRTLRPPHDVAAQVQRDAVEPGRELRFALEARAARGRRAGTRPARRRARLLRGRAGGRPGRRSAAPSAG